MILRLQSHGRAPAFGEKGGGVRSEIKNEQSSARGHTLVRLAVELPLPPPSSSPSFRSAVFLFFLVDGGVRVETSKHIYLALVRLVLRVVATASFS